jgi:hypothetical protein
MSSDAMPMPDRDQRLRTAPLEPAQVQGSPDAYRVEAAGTPRDVLAKGNAMSGIKIAAIVLIAAGVLGLVYGSFSYTKSTHEAKIGPIELSVKEKQTINVPVWAGVGAIVIGGILLVFGGRKS